MSIPRITSLYAHCVSLRNRWKEISGTNERHVLYAAIEELKDLCFDVICAHDLPECRIAGKTIGAGWEHWDAEFRVGRLEVLVAATQAIAAGKHGRRMHI